MSAPTVPFLFGSVGRVAFSCRRKVDEDGQSTANSRGTGRSKAQRKFYNWLNSYNAVSEWLAKYELESLIQQHGGLVKIQNFLPTFVADGISRSWKPFQTQLGMCVTADARVSSDAPSYVLCYLHMSTA